MVKTFEEFINKSADVESIAIVYKDQEYWVDSKDLSDKENSKIFAFEDPGLETIATSNGKSLMFKVEDIEDQLKD